jgi:hypothetical protein
LLEERTAHVQLSCPTLNGRPVTECIHVYGAVNVAGQIVNLCEVANNGVFAEVDFPRARSHLQGPEDSRLSLNPRTTPSNTRYQSSFNVWVVALIARPAALFFSETDARALAKQSAMWVLVLVSALLACAHGELQLLLISVSGRSLCLHARQGLAFFARLSSHDVL